MKVLLKRKLHPVCRQPVNRVLAGIAPMLLAGCLSVPVSPPVAADEPGPSPASEEGPPVTDGGQLMYELMIAELAGRRGLLDIATEGYLRAAERTEDARIAERATQLALFSRQWQQAEQAARRWQVIDPDAIEPYEAIAQSLLRQSRAEDAAEAFAVVIEKRETDRSVTLTEITSILEQEASRVPSVDVLRALEERYPGEAILRLSLARVLLQQQERAAALDEVEKVLADTPGSVSALLLRSQILLAQGDADEGLKAIREALDENADSVPLRLGYARLLVEAGRYDSLQPELERVFDAIEGEDPTALLTISLLALDARRLDAAARYLDALLDTGEFADQANYYRAGIADQQQDFALAIEHYERVQPGELYLGAQIRVAELLAVTGELDAGRERLRDLAMVLPDPSMQPDLLAAEARMLQDAGRPVEAVDVLTKGLERFESHPDLLYSRALAADAAGNSDMLVQDLETLIDAQPENAHALNALGYHYADNNIELATAETYLVKANRLLPNDPAIMDSLGWLRYRQGQLDEALVLLRKAYTAFPDSEIAAHLGEVMWMLGDEAAARQLWADALLDAPDDDRLNRVVKRFTK